ncbi:MAG: flavodoxin family protein [Planctomycetota bacterium]
MRESAHIVALMGSYRRDGTVDRTVKEILSAAQAQGATTTKLDLIDHDVQFCTNCRSCCQEPGPERGRCVLDDDADAILSALERADGVILAAPVNCGDVNARTRQLFERMISLVYWPWGRPGPKPRRRPHTPALLVTSSAAPAVLTRLLRTPLRTLGHMAELLGARPTDRLVVGLAGGRDPELRPRTRRRAQRAARRLLANVSRCRSKSAPE